MRTLFIIGMILLAGCQKEDASPVYTDISGSWAFKSDDASGDFTISKAMDGKFYVNAGNFTFKGSAKNLIGVQNEVVLSGFKIAAIALEEKPYGNYIQFYYSGYVKSDYSEMKVKSYSFKNGSLSSNKTLTDSLTISRR